MPPWSPSSRMFRRGPSSARRRSPISSVARGRQGPGRRWPPAGCSSSPRGSRRRWCSRTRSAPLPTRASPRWPSSPPSKPGHSASPTRSRSTSTSAAIPTWRWGPPGSSDSTFRKTSRRPTSPSRSASSGSAGTFRSPTSSPAISTCPSSARWEKPRYGPRSSPRCSPWASPACGMGRDGRTSSLASCTARRWP